MRCTACGRTISVPGEDTCTACALRAEREVTEPGGGTSVEYWQFGGKTVEIRGLPAHVRIEDTCPDHPDKPIADSILTAPDVQHEFMIRHA